MKKRTLPVLAAILLLAALPQTANAFGVSILGITLFRAGEHVARVEKLPKTPEYAMPSGKKTVHVDLGIYHKQLAILGVPLLNWGKRSYVLYHSGFFGGTQYWTPDPFPVEAFNEELGFSLPPEPRLPFWHRWGGKLFVLLLAAAFGGFVLWVMNKPDTPAAGATPPGTPSPDAVA